MNNNAEEEYTKGTGYLNVIAAISVTGVLKVVVIDVSTREAVFKTFCLDDQENVLDCDNRVRTTDPFPSKHLDGPSLLDLVKKEQVILLDRLGHSGRSKDRG